MGTNAVLKGRAFAKTTMIFNGGSLVSQTPSSTSVNMTIGSCQKFAVLAGTSVTFGQGNTVIINGSVAVSPGTSITGTYQNSSGTTDTNSAAAVACVFDLGTAYSIASTATCSNYLSSSELSGLTLTPGVYCSSLGTFTIAKSAYVTLDGRNGTNAVWIFKTTTTLITGDFSSMILINGALSKNIYWAVGSTASVGYAAFFAGNIMAQSSISHYHYTILDGRTLSFAAVSFTGYSSVSLPNGLSVVTYPKVQLYLGGCLPFVITAGSTAVFSLALTVIHSGSIGNSPGMESYFYPDFSITIDFI
jgi:hypothetical protein